MFMTQNYRVNVLLQVFLSPVFVVAAEKSS